MLGILLQFIEINLGVLMYHVGYVVCCNQHIYKITESIMLQEMVQVGSDVFRNNGNKSCGSLGSKDHVLSNLLFLAVCL